MPLFSNLPPKKYLLQILHLGVLAFPPPPPKPTLPNQVPTLLDLTFISINNSSNSQEEYRIRQLEITIRDLTNKLILQEIKKLRF